jgi:hypothetical protein
MELGNHAEFLGVMKSTEMLSTFFVHDGGETQKWRLKGHAEKDFWKWMASWAVCISHPRDIGFEQEGYDLPELRIHEIIVDCDSTPLDGELFAMQARTLQERRGARKNSLQVRIDKCAEIIGQFPEHQFLVWSNLNTEAEGISKAADMENVTGSDSDERKEKCVLDFSNGMLQRLSSKSSICGFGINMQSCNKMAFLGLSDSFEDMYQAIRRCYRFGQQNPVDVYVIISSLEGAVLQNIKRKEADAEKMQQSLIEHMADLTKTQLTTSQARQKVEYNAEQIMQLPAWLISKGGVNISHATNKRNGKNRTDLR